MNVREKALLAGMPLVLAGAVGFSMTMPAMEEANQKVAAVEEKQTELESFESKLRDRAKLSKQKADLEKEIAALRESVPKAPDLDLLAIDLEKMCLESGCELISFVPASKEALKDLGLDADTDQRLSERERMKSKIKQAVQGSAGAAGGKPEESSKKDDGGLEKAIMECRIMGDYSSTQEFVSKLEHYQRVVGITKLQTFIPKKFDSKELPDEQPPGEDEPIEASNKNLISVLILSAYYLP